MRNRQNHCNYKVFRPREKIRIQVKSLEICKAKSITIKENIAIYVHQKNKELGFVGSPNKIDTNIIKKLIKDDYVPVITPMGLDEKNQAYNVNADVAAGALATSLKSRRLLLMTDVEGVYDKNKILIY